MHLGEEFALLLESLQIIVALLVAVSKGHDAVRVDYFWGDVGLDVEGVQDLSPEDEVFTVVMLVALVKAVEDELRSDQTRKIVLSEDVTADAGVLEQFQVSAEVLDLLFLHLLFLVRVNESCSGKVHVFYLREGPLSRDALAFELFVLVVHLRNGYFFRHEFVVLQFGRVLEGENIKAWRPIQRMLVTFALEDEVLENEVLDQPLVLPPCSA